MSSRRRYAPIAALILSTLSAPGTFATSAIWTPTTGGNWSDPASWSTNPAVPNAIGDVATFTSSGSANKTITLDIPVTLGALSLANITNRIYTLAGSGTGNLTFQSASGNSTLTSNGCTSTISANIALVSNLSIIGNITLSGGLSGSGNLTLNGQTTLSGANTMIGTTFIAPTGCVALTGAGTLGANTVLNGGTLFLNVSSAAPITVSSGNLNINAAATGPITLSSGIVKVGATGSLGANNLTLNGGTVSLAADLSLSSFLSGSSSSGFISVDTGATAFTNGGTNQIDFSTLVAGSSLRLGASYANSSIASCVSLIPDNSTHTLRFGGGIANIALTVNPTLVDYNSIPTNLDLAGPSTAILTGNNSYTGITTISGNVQITNAHALGAGSGSEADETIINHGGNLSTGSITLGGEKIVLHGGSFFGSSSGTVSIIAASTLSGNFSGSISGSGDITVSGSSSFTASNSFTGNLTVKSGTLTVASSSSLGSPQGQTFLAGGNLNLSAPSDDAFTITTGCLTLNAPQTGNILLAGGCLSMNAASTGNISGTGSIFINAPAASPISLSGGNITFKFTGAYAGDITIANTTLQLSQTPSSELISGNLAVAGNSTLTAPSSVLQVSGFTGTGNFTIATNSNLVASAASTFAGNFFDSGSATFKSSFTNSGVLTLAGSLTANSTFMSSGPLNVTGFLNLNSNLNVSGLLTNYGSVTLAGNGQLDAVETFGNVTVNGNVSINHLIIAGQWQYTFTGLAGSGNLSVSDRNINLVKGSINFTGHLDVDAITVNTNNFNSALIQALPSDFAGPVNLQSGQLTLYGPISSLTQVNVNNPSAALSLGAFQATSTFPCTINLNNTNLYINNSTTFYAPTLSGNVNLGSTGAAFVAQSSASTAPLPTITVSGSISGGTLTSSSSVTLVLSGNNSFSSVAAYGKLTLDGTVGGVVDRIPDSASVQLYGATLELDGKKGANTTTVETVGDLVGQRGLSYVKVVGSAPGSTNTVQLNAASLSLAPGATISFEDGQATSRWLGQAADGPRIFISNLSDENFLGGAYVYNSLSFYRPSFQGGTLFNSTFLKYSTTTGVTPMADSDYSTVDESQWNATLPVMALGTFGPVLTGDRQVLALRLGNSTYGSGPGFSIDAYTLNVISGGILMCLGSSINSTSAGHLTAGGNASSATLYFHAGVGQGFGVMANITDNPGPDGKYDPTPGGPLDADNGQVSVVFSEFGGFDLSGNNTYTGTTYVNGAGVSFLKPASIPSGPIFVENGGSVTFIGPSIANSHDITLHNGNIAGNTSLNPASLTVESGNITIPIVGNATITKIGSETFSFAGNSTNFLSGFTGSFNILGGSLAIYSGNYANPLSIQNGTLLINSTNQTTSFTGPVVMGDNSDISISNTNPNFATAFTFAPSSLSVGNNAWLTVQGAWNVFGSLDPFTSTTDPTKHLNLNVNGVLYVNNGVKVAGIVDSGLLVDTNTTFSVAQYIGGSNVTIKGTMILRPDSHTFGDFGGFTFGTGAKIDITNNPIVIQPSSTSKATVLSQIRSYVAQGKGSGNWMGTGITSSTVAANSSHMTIVVLDNAVDGLSTFDGVAADVDQNSILVVPVYFGDSNLDGRVDLLDLQNFVVHWQQPAADWTQGDYNGDGHVDLLDLQYIANNWQAGVGSGSGSSFQEALSLFPTLSGNAMPAPEPLSLSALTVVLPAFLLRRRRSGMAGSYSHFHNAVF